MRITELLEGKQFNDLDFIKNNKDGGRVIDYDLVEDIIFFMNNDDDNYRKLVYPSIANCIDKISANKKTSPRIFKLAVEESYKNYINNFPIKELPDTIEEKVLEKICKKMHEEVCNNYSEGKYKD